MATIELPGCMRRSGVAREGEEGARVRVQRPVPVVLLSSSAGRITPVAAFETSTSSESSSSTNAAGLLGVADVAAQQQRLGAALAGSRRRLLRRRVVAQVADRHARRPEVGEAERDLPPDAARAARHEDGLAGEDGHYGPPAAAARRRSRGWESPPSRSGCCGSTGPSSAFERGEGEALEELDLLLRVAADRVVGRAGRGRGLARAPGSAWRSAASPARRARRRRRSSARRAAPLSAGSVIGATLAG